MANRKGFNYVPGVALAGVLAVVALSNGCSSTSGASQVCNGLDVQSQAQATVKAWADAVTALDQAATRVEARWLAVCNEINTDLGLDRSKTTAQAACGVLNAYINAALQNGVTISLQVQFACEADLSAQATCEGQCRGTASCDVRANCRGGDVVVDCNGSCSGRCDVTAPSFQCNGTCKGECTANAAVRCQGQCTGVCDAPQWTGTCDAGCTANFTGTCGGNCTGTCDAQRSSGRCVGTCVGSCDAKATGSCRARCAGTLSGGQCSGNCTGKCNVAAGAQCNGACNGTCSYTPGQATCQGACHGDCSAALSPPTCTGQLDCQASAECHANCQAQASANVYCPPPQANVTIRGDDKLYASFQTHLADIGAAINLTAALKDPIGVVAVRTGSTFQAIGDIGVSGAACIAAQLQVAAHAQASISVSVSASATVSGTAS